MQSIDLKVGRLLENSTVCSAFYLQEQNTVPSLRKALKDVAMEKDAAVVARVSNCTISLFDHYSADSHILQPYKPL